MGMQDVLEWLFPAFRWLFNPDELFSAALTIVGLFFGAVGQMVTWFGSPELGAELSGFGAKVSAAPIKEAYRVGLYVMSPVVSPTLLNACITVIVDGWLLAVMLKIATWVKSHWWSAPA